MRRPLIAGWIVAAMLGLGLVATAEANGPYPRPSVQKHRFNPYPQVSPYPQFNPYPQFVPLKPWHHQPHWRHQDQHHRHYHPKPHCHW